METVKLVAFDVQEISYRRMPVYATRMTIDAGDIDNRWGKYFNLYNLWKPEVHYDEAPDGSFHDFVSRKTKIIIPFPFRKNGSDEKFALANVYPECYNAIYYPYGLALVKSNWVAWVIDTNPNIASMDIEIQI